MSYRRLQLILTLAFLTLLIAGGVAHYMLGRSIEAHIAQQRELEQQEQALTEGLHGTIQKRFETGILPSQAQLNAGKSKHEELVSNMIDNLTPAAAEQQWRSIIAISLVCVVVIQIAAQTSVHIWHRRG